LNPVLPTPDDILARYNNFYDNMELSVKEKALITWLMAAVG